MRCNTATSTWLPVSVKIMIKPLVCPLNMLQTPRTTVVGTGTSFGIARAAPQSSVLSRMAVSSWHIR